MKLRLEKIATGETLAEIELKPGFFKMISDLDWAKLMNLYERYLKLWQT